MQRLIPSTANFITRIQSVRTCWLLCYCESESRQLDFESSTQRTPNRMYAKLLESSISVCFVYVLVFSSFATTTSSSTNIDNCVCFLCMYVSDVYYIHCACVRLVVLIEQRFQWKYRHRSLFIFSLVLRIFEFTANLQWKFHNSTSSK